MNPYNIVRPAWFVSVVGAALCLFGGTCTAQSSEPGGDGIRFSGFGTVGVTHAAAPAGWGFLRTTEQPASDRSTRFDLDSRLGAQVNYAASPEIELVAQMLVTRRVAGTPAADSLEWAFAAYRPTADLTLRAGRLNLDQYVMSDYRNVGFAYLYARPPVEFYSSVPSNLDGVDITHTWTSGESRWRAKGFFGRSRIIGIPLNGTFGFSLSREVDGLLLRASWSRTQLAYNYRDLTPLIDGLDQVRALPIPSVSAEATALRNVLDLAARPVTYATMGATYERAQWQVAAEIAQITLGTSRGTSGYVSLGRRIGEVTVFGVVSVADANTPVAPIPTWGTTLAPVIGPAAAQQAQLLGAVAAQAANRTPRQTTYSLGARWDMHPRLALKVQWDRVDIRQNGSFLWSNATQDPGRANIATALLDFVF